MNKVVKEKIKQLKEIYKDILFNYSENGKGDWLVASLDRYVPSKKQNALFCDGIRINPKRIILHRDFIKSVEIQDLTTDKYSNMILIQIELNTKGAKYIHNNCNISLSWLMNGHIELNNDPNEFYYFETETEAKLFLECK